MNVIEKLFRLKRSVLSWIGTHCFYQYGFRQFGKRSRLYFPEILGGLDFISIGSDVSIFDGAWIMALPLKNRSAPNILIGDNVYIGRRLHLVGVAQVVIDRNVLIADNVFITDSTHSYKDMNVAIKNQPIEHIGDVHIGEGAWIGENAVINGVCVGRNAIVGANSFVNRDVPDNCVVAGAPARIITRGMSRAK